MFTVRCQTVLSLVFLCLFATSCKYVARLSPSKSADGIARISARSLGVLIKAIQEDTRCGFSASTVTEQPFIDGEIGRDGHATWTVSECVLDFGDEPVVVMTACDGSSTLAKGKVTVTAARTIHGILTGNPAHPVIPKGPDSVRIELSVAPQGFVVSSSNDHYQLTQYDGKLEFVAHPHLAAQSKPGDTQGLCVVPTSNVTFEKVRYKDTHVRIEGAFIPVDTTITESDFHMQVGQWGERENSLEGTVTIWGSPRKVPSDEKGLDPDYERAHFLKSQACMPDVGEAPSYQCVPMESKLLHGVLGLSAQHVGTVVEYLETHPRCGFSSPDVLARAQLDGELGGKTGSMRLQAPTMCEMVADRVQVAINRQGVARYLSGRMTVLHAHKQMTGRRVMDKAALDKKLVAYRALLSDKSLSSADVLAHRPEPILPTTVNPATIEIDVDVHKLEVWEVCTQAYSDNPHHCSRQEGWEAQHEPKLVIEKGKLAGKVIPWLGVNQDKSSPAYGIPSVKTTIARLQDVQLRGALVRLFAQGNQFVLDVADSNATLQVGTLRGEGNWMMGRARLGELELSLHQDNQPIALDPTYKEEVFHNSFQYGLSTSLDAVGAIVLAPPPPAPLALSPRTSIATEGGAKPVALPAASQTVVPIPPQSSNVPTPLPSQDPSPSPSPQPPPSSPSPSPEAEPIPLNTALDRQIGHGILGMSAMAMGVIAELLERDAHCGFSSPAVLAGAQLTGILGAHGGTATWNISHPCTITLPSKVQVSVDKQGVARYAQGTVRVWGSKKLAGRLLMDATMLAAHPNSPPILPSTMQPVQLQLQVQAEGFEVSQTCIAAGNTAHAFHCQQDSKRVDDTKQFRIQKGRLAATLKPRLAAENGLCQHPTALASMSQLTLQEADVLLSAQGMSFLQSNVSAMADMQIGTVEGEGNWLRGYYVADAVKHLYGDNVSGVLLDPDYNEAVYHDAFMRDTHWQIPHQDADCSEKSVIGQLGHGVAGLSGLMLGQIANLIEADTHCGFSSNEVMRQVRISGKPGYDGATATWKVEKCSMNFPNPVAVQVNAQGVVRYMRGELLVSAIKTMRGRYVMPLHTVRERIGKVPHRPEPILPTSMQPVDFAIVADVQQAQVWEACSNQGDVASAWHCSKQARFHDDQPVLQVMQGRLQGKVTPLLAKDADTTRRTYGLCSLPTALARLEDVVLRDAEVLLTAQHKAFRLAVAGDRWTLLAGRHNGIGNTLEGRMVLEGHIATFAAGTPLDPNYDDAVFYDAFMHNDKIDVPTSDSACSGKHILAENAARLLVQNLGGLAKYATKPRAKGEGFLSGGRILLGSKTTKREDNAIVYHVNNGQLGKVGGQDLKPVLRLKNSALAKKVADMLGQTEIDGLGNAMWRIGSVGFSGSMRMLGKKWTFLNLVDMQQPDAIRLQFDRIQPRDFAAFEAKGLDLLSVREQIHSMGSSVAMMVMHAGELSAVVEPITKQRPGDTVYRVPTPIAKLSKVKATLMPVTILTDGMEMRFVIDASDFEALNGFFKGEGNYIRGSLTVDGEAIQFDSKLVPDYPRPYNQAEFDRR